MLAIDNLRYADGRAARSPGITLQVHAGELVAAWPAWRAGQFELVNAITGLIEPTGTIYVAGENVTDAPILDAAATSPTCRK